MIFRTLALVAVLLVSAPLDAQHQTTPLQVPYRLFTLSNGLTVILHQDRSVPVIGVNVWLSRRIEELIVYRLPEEYFEQYVAKIQAVTPAAVQKAAATYIQPAKSLVVVVGDAKTIEGPVRALKLGPVRVIGVQEAFGQ